MKARQLYKDRHLRLGKEQVELTRKTECWLEHEPLMLSSALGPSSEHERIDSLVSRIVFIPSHNIALWEIERRP
jgi:hypothetical protein